jgi:predicted acylesterase/phospholipase RssA
MQHLSPPQGSRKRAYPSSASRPDWIQNSPKHRLGLPTLVAILLGWISIRSHAFVPHSTRSPALVQSRIRLADQITEKEQDESVWKWNASGSFGSLLMQLQKKEEALLAVNETFLEQDVVDLDPRGEHRAEEARTAPDLKPLEEQQSQEQLATMDWDTAKELDNTITILSNGDRARQELQTLPLSALQKSLLGDGTTTSPEQADSTVILPLSRKAHYEERIGRDLRHLAVSIAASTETVADWQTFCANQGGLYPVLETIREGAQHVAPYLTNTKVNNATTSMDSQGIQNPIRMEESFQAACSACRALRDLCAISPEVSAVLTDGILRANAAWEGSLMRDFCTLLQYASDIDGPTRLDGMPPTLSRGQSRKEASVNEAAWAVQNRFTIRRKQRRDTRLRCKLYITQLLLAVIVASDDAVAAIRKTDGLAHAVLQSSSFARKQQRRRWLRYPVEMAKWLWRRRRRTVTQESANLRRPFLEAANIANDLEGQVQRTANQILAAIGHNQWRPKIPGQKGLRILCLDGGGSRGMTAVSAVKCMMDAAGNGNDVADSFDLICGTSTGGIIAFLIGLRRESSAQAVERYNQLIKQIFVKPFLSTPLMVFTTASYDESPFMNILSTILQDKIMLDSRADPAVPLVCCLTSKMSSTPTHVALFRNYNYAKDELRDPFTINPDKAREDLGLPLSVEHPSVQSGSYKKELSLKNAPGARLAAGSRYPGSFRVLQRYALRASTAAPTVFKPVMMGGEMYCDGGIVASNPAAVAVHEARTLFPDIPIELVVSVGTGAFLEQKSAPRIGWDGIIGQIVNSATDGEQIHHILEDILGESSILGPRSSVSKTRYFRFNPVIGMPDEFPIDVTDPKKLTKLRQLTKDYMNEPEQCAKLQQISDLLGGRDRWKQLVISKPGEVKR